MILSGILGSVMARHGFGAAPLVMGLILGGVVEENLSRPMIIMDNEWLRLFKSWIVNLFFGMNALSLGWPMISKYREQRAKKAA
jgi:putative tricarboxylic transport membrane protein